jgi:hypothetical protein
MKRVGAGMRVILASSLSDVSSQIVNSIKGVILNIIDFLTPLMTTVCIGMIVIGILLIGLRQEFYGLRLVIGGGIGLIIIYLIIPLLLGFL